MYGYNVMHRLQSSYIIFVLQGSLRLIWFNISCLNLSCLSEGNVPLQVGMCTIYPLLTDSFPDYLYTYTGLYNGPQK